LPSMGLTPIANKSGAFCGVLTLSHGVEFIALFHIISSMVVLGMVSHVEEDFTGGGMSRRGGRAVEILQDVEGIHGNAVFLGSMSLIGMPFAIVAAVAALYRIQNALRGYLYFMFFSLVVGLFLNTCWTLICSPLILYFGYVVWSLCEDIADHHFPMMDHLRLCETPDALKYAYSPEVVGQTMQINKDGQRVGGFDEDKQRGNTMSAPVVPPTRMMWMGNESFRNGTPQSFIQQPVSGFLPQGPSFMP